VKKSVIEKLKVSRETIQRLSNPDIAKVNGGEGLTPQCCISCHTGTVGMCCLETQ